MIWIHLLSRQPFWRQLVTRKRSKCFNKWSVLDNELTSKGLNPKLLFWRQLITSTAWRLGWCQNHVNVKIVTDRWVQSKYGVYNTFSPGEHYVFTVFSAPYNVWCRVSGGIARKRQVFPLSHNQLWVIILGHNLGRDCKGRKVIWSHFHFKVFDQVSLPTTSKYPERCLMGSVLIWHMYQPRSSGCTLCSCKVQTLDFGLLSEIRGLRVITLLWMVRIVCVSTRTQATCREQIRKRLSNLGRLSDDWRVILR